MKAQARRRWDGAVVLRFPYDAYLISALKAQIPAHAREYDPARRVWTVRPPYAGLAVDLLCTVFPSADTADDATGRPSHATHTTGSDAHAALHLLPSAPPQLIEAAYRVLARIHHPDAGGDHETMHQLNTAIERLRKRAG